MVDRLYQCAVILQPTDDERKAGQRAKIIVPPTEFFLAKSEEEAQLVVARDPRLADYLEVADRLEVAVRPF
jgi:hypothetical protein